MQIFSYKKAQQPPQLSGQCPKKMFWGKMIQPFGGETPFSNAHWPVLGAFLACSWAERCFLQKETEAEKRENSSEPKEMGKRT